ncbi:NAD(+) diphosphatase [Pseudoalteromonas mariniglutinosa]|uniref:NAD(+) diphosphatase n=1 Tax=Pseudoalteromonas mariniglutinosa TaxID=206042 RepID=UPI00384B0824
MLNYSQMPLDRASNLRKDPRWLKAQMTAHSQWLLVKDNQTLFFKDSAQVCYIRMSQLNDIDVSQGILLGLNAQGTAHFALDVSDVQVCQLTAVLEKAEFVDIRKLGPQVELQQGSIAALARGLCFWHTTHKFCGRCGHPNHMVEAGHSRLCENQVCMHQTFPRTDPAVIMIVTKVFADGMERCLLGRQASWPTGVFSTLAGFVDPGETLEQAVTREVMEEAGIEVENVRYIASQPWPFPSSIMFGFVAKAKSEQICVDKDELDDARWFSRDELNQFGQWHEQGEHFKLTREDSISRFLVEYWRNL